MKITVLVPAGPRAAFDGRPEHISRLALFETPVALQARKMGVNFGFEIKAPDKFSVDFNPRTLGVPFAIHPPARLLSGLWAMRENSAYVSEFWRLIERWASWQPLYAVFHGAELNRHRPLNEHRFECRVELSEWLRLGEWHIGILDSMLKRGLPACLETLHLNNYVFRDDVWLPITHLVERVGFLRDLLTIAQATGCGIVVDSDHLLGTISALHGTALELLEFDDLCFAKPGRSPSFEKFFGFAAEPGKIPSALQVDSIANSRIFLEHAFPYVRAWHADGDFFGNSGQQVVAIPETECDVEYHGHLARMFKGDPYVRELVTGRRETSHGPIEITPYLIRMLGKILAKNSPLGLDTTFVVEPVAKGENTPDPWYWSRPDALEYSFANFLIALMKAMK